MLTSRSSTEIYQITGMRTKNAHMIGGSLSDADIPHLLCERQKGLSIARAHAFNMQRIDGLLAELQDLYERLELSSFPQLILNIDETGLSSVSSSHGKVYAVCGSSKNFCVTDCGLSR